MSGWYFFDINHLQPYGWSMGAFQYGDVILPPYVVNSLIVWPLYVLCQKLIGASPIRSCNLLSDKILKQRMRNVVFTLGNWMSVITLPWSREPSIAWLSMDWFEVIRYIFKSINFLHTLTFYRFDIIMLWEIDISRGCALYCPMHQYALNFIIINDVKAMEIAIILS